MTARLGATILGAVGAALLLIAIARAWVEMRRVGTTAAAPLDAGDSAHPADPLPLAGLEAVIVALGMSAGMLWAAVLGVLGALALVRYARRTRLVVTGSAVVFGSGSGAASIPLDALGSLVPAPRNGSLRSYGTLGFADRTGTWVAVVRPAALRRPGVMAATVVARTSLVRHEGEDGWRSPGATAPTGRLPYFSR